MTLTDVAPTGIFSPGLRTMTMAAVTMVGVQAFEAVAVSTAMPTVAHALGGLNQYALAFGIPAAAAIIGMVVAGSWSDRKGPVNALAAGWSLFVAGLLVSGTAMSMPMLIGGRALQGLGTGLTAVALYVVVGKAYPESTRPRIFSAFAAAWVLPAMIGPAVAGFLVVHANWRWVFLSVPFIAAAAALVGWGPSRRLCKEPGDAAPATATARDGLRKGLFATLAGVAACLLSIAGQNGPLLALPMTAVAVVLLIVAVPRLLPTGTFRSARGLPTVILLRGLASAAFTGAEVFLPLLLSRERGLSPTAAGVVLTVGALGWSAGSMLQGRISSPARRAPLLRAGFAMLTLGIVGVALTVWPAVPLLAVYPAWVLAGLGMGIAYPTLSVLTLDLSAPAEQGRNTSALQVNDTLLQSITLAVSGTVFAALVAQSHWAPYVAGLAVAGTAAVTGAALTSRVRVALPGGQSA
jgi:MFS family permease